MKLSNAALAHLPDDIAVPQYDRAALSPGILHIGLGNFHRAHQAWYLHRLMQAGQAMDWAIIGAGVRPGDAQMRDKLQAQDYLTTLVTLDPNDALVEVTGAMIDFLPVEPDNAAMIRCMSNPMIRIVALTVTEGGYFIDPTAGGLDLAHPDIVHDLANPQRPKTAFGAIVAGLRARCMTGDRPFTVLSCDNLQGNGDITRRAVVALARQTDTTLADWIDANGAFPNSMVDCIVPATGPAEIALATELGVTDAAPVTHEAFRQWVLEDRFCAGRPDWDVAGAIFTDRVHDYEKMKIRILNAGHQVVANAGELLSVDTIAGCMDDASIAALFDKVQREEIAPYVAPVPGMAPLQYVDLIKARFANPKIRDTTRRVAFDGSSRHTGFVLPILRDALAEGGPVEGLALVEALWARMCAGTRDDGSEIAANDPEWDKLCATARIAKADPEAWLAQRHIYGDLADEMRFVSAFTACLSRIWKDGARAAIDSYCSAQSR